ncbi:MAG TPA: BtpA/SgcQ family protein [Candidatus Cloacimonadota bacterium]|nr:BtpA/SgcQ family protein [Candidatus Cloacimonadota bacterium]
MNDFFTRKMIIGMVHVQALSGTPRNHLSIREIVSSALAEAQLYQELGLDAILLENMHDTPYQKREVGPEIISEMTAVACAVRDSVSIPIGIQILAGANQAALAVAKAARLDFIRAEGFVFAHVADEGIIQSDAGALLRYRKQIGAEDIMIFADIKKKHSAHQLTADVDIAQTASAAEFFLADGLIVTGSSTGKPADLQELQAVRAATKLPLLIGSGLTAANIKSYLPLADGFIVGSDFKEDGYWANPLSRPRIESFLKAL